MASSFVEVDLDQARELVYQEAAALKAMAEGFDDQFVRVVEMIHGCSGSVVLTGIGKAGIVAQKISATLASTGTPSHFIHAAEAVHGDLGRLQSNDIAMVLSYSGESEEIVRLIALLKQLSVPMIGITGNLKSALAKHSQVTISLGRIEEICPLGLAPTTSTTCMLALGDALALTVMKLRNFKAEDYARYHPGGSLGRKLVTVEQASLFSRGKALPQAPDSDTVQQAIQRAEQNTDLRHGCILLVDSAGRLSGLLTDGDLRRGIAREGSEFHRRKVREMMTKNPKVVYPDTLVSEALAIFHQNRIDEIPVVDQDHKPVGLIDVQDVIALRVVQ